MGLSTVLRVDGGGAPVERRVGDGRDIKPFPESGRDYVGVLSAATSSRAGISHSLNPKGSSVGAKWL